MKNLAVDREVLAAQLGELATRGVYVGTSSWKYPGWCGQLYTEDRYVYRGRFSQARFERHCLAEYAEVFKTVGVDAAYYKFPDRRYLEGLVAQVPPDFRFSFKVTDEITIKRFTRLPRFGARAGQANANFLNADLFASAFLGPCEPFRQNVGLLMFEFSRFYPSDFARGRDFLAALEGFLGQLPAGWPYGVEIRNRAFLQPDYFAMLTRHGVAHVYNSWQDMPTVGEQLALPGSRTTPAWLGARFLLTPGRKYEDAVQRFSPYDRVQEPNAEGRAAGGRLIAETAAAGGRTQAFIYVNNRFEGNALGTILAMIEAAGTFCPTTRPRE
ncbi:MAG: DUF72 domain-containing protein [Verrucomicrobia bacterium]|nr:DUF72 domain-containing protein [Verrucomicrobiota bacterium]